jgi:Bacterial regulatory protein, Fis family
MGAALIMNFNEAINWSPGVTLEQIEKEVILRAFRFYRGNKTTTALALAISIRTLDHKLEKYEQDGKKQRERDDLARAEREKFAARQRGIVTTHPQTGTSVLGAAAGVRMESVANASAQSDMPVPKRKKV